MNDDNSNPAQSNADDDLLRQMLDWTLEHNLNYLIRFHNAVRRLLAEKASEARGVDRRVEHDLRRYQDINAANSLLLLVGYLEESLRLLWQRGLPNVPLEARTSIDKYKPLFAEAGVDLGNLSSWAVIKDAMQVRHCLLHANGRLSLMRDADAVRACLRRHPADLRLNNDRIVVTSRFLKRCAQATHETVEVVVDGLGNRLYRPAARS